MGVRGVRASRNGPVVHVEIRVRGELNGRWSAWFDGLQVISDDIGQTIIAGQVADQAALHGLLTEVRDLGLELLPVRRIYHDEDEGPTRQQKGALHNLGSIASTPADTDHQTVAWRESRGAKL